MLFLNKIKKYLKAGTLTTLSNWANKAITILLNLYSIRILSQKLSEEEYALYIILMSFQSWIILIDLGIGYSVQNYFTEKKAKNEDVSIFLYNSYLLSWILLIFFFVLFFFVRELLAINYLGEVVSLDVPTKVNYVSTVFLLLGINFLNEIIYKIKYSEEEGYKGIWAYSIGRLIGFLGILVLYLSPKEHTVIEFLLANLLPSTIISTFYFGYRFVKIAHFNYFSCNAMKKIITRGFLFWLYTIALYLPFFTEYWVLGKFLMARDVVFYNLSKRLYEIPSFMYNAILLVYWTDFTKLYIHGRAKEIIKKLKKSIMVGMVLLILATFALAFLSSFIMTILTPDFTFTNTTDWVIIFGIYFILRVWADTFATFLQSISRLRYLIVSYASAGVLSIVLEFWLTPSWKLYGIALALIIPMCFLCIFLPLYTKKIIQSIQE